MRHGSRYATSTLLSKDCVDVEGVAGRRGGLDQGAAACLAALLVNSTARLAKDVDGIIREVDQPYLRDQRLSVERPCDGSRRP